MCCSKAPRSSQGLSDDARIPRIPRIPRDREVTSSHVPWHLGHLGHATKTINRINRHCVEQPETRAHLAETRNYPSHTPSKKSRKVDDIFCKRATSFGFGHRHPMRCCPRNFSWWMARFRLGELPNVYVGRCFRCVICCYRPSETVVTHSQECTSECLPVNI